MNFTRREIDILACLFNARGTSRMASLLDISPRTVGNHIRNLMLKLGCNSREGILDFIEKDNKQSLLRAHYSHLILEKAFKDILKTIRKRINKTTSYSLIYWAGQKDYYTTLEKLKAHLELVGLNIQLEKRETPDSIANLIHESQTGKHGIYIISELMADINNIAFPTKNRPNNAQTSPNTLFLFMKKVDLGEPPHALGSVKCIDFSRLENYCLLVLEVLKALFPHVNFEDKIKDLKNYLERGHTPSELKGSQGSRYSPLLPFFSAIRNNIFRGKKWPIFFTLSVAISTFCIGTIIFKGCPEENNRVDPPEEKRAGNLIRSGFLLPSNTMLLKRVELMTEINNKFKDQKDIPTVALIGIGGAGKTTVARHYARQQKENVVWEINAETRGSLENSFEQLAHVLAKTERDRRILQEILEVQDSTTKNENIITFVKERLKSREPWFLIYDNVDNFADIQKYFPQDMKIWGEGKILLTTRNNNFCNSSYIDQLVHIGELDPEQKLGFFIQIMDHGRDKKLSSTQVEDAKKILEQIPPFPLDISIFTHYLKTINISYAKYLGYLNQGGENFSIHQENFLKEMGEYAKTRYSIITLSLQKIIDIHPDFKDLLLLVSLLDSQNIPRDLLSKYKGEEQIDNFIYNLQKYSFINETPLPSLEASFSLHRSTQAIILEYLRKGGFLDADQKSLKEIAHTIEKYIDHLTETKNFSSNNNMITHLKKITSEENVLPEFIKGVVVGALGNLYFHLGYDLKAKPLLEKRLQTLNTSVHKDYAAIAKILIPLGQVYRELAYYEEAKKTVEEGLSIYRKYFPENYTGIVLALRYVSKVYRSLGNYEKARDVLEESLAISTKHIAEKPVKSAVILGYLGYMYKELGNFQKAEDLIEKSLTILKKHYPPGHVEIARSLTYLGKVYKDIGDLKNAVDLLEESCASHKKAFGEDNIRAAPVLVDLGEAYRKLGNLEKAKKLITQGLLIYIKHYPRSHIEVARVFTHLGNAYKDGGNYTKAKDILRKNLVIYEKHYGKYHMETAQVLRDLGNCYFLEGNTEAAEKLLTEALTIFKDNQRPESYTCLESLAELYLKKSSFANQKGNREESKNLRSQAGAYLKKALEVVKTRFPVDSPHRDRIEVKFQGIEKSNVQS